MRDRTPVLLVFVVWLGGCGSSGASSGGGADAATEGAVTGPDATQGDGGSEPDGDAGAGAADAPGSPCSATATSSLAGVEIRFPQQPSTFTLAQAAAGISFDYEIVVSSDVSAVTPDAQGACTPPGASGLIVHEVISGSGQQYCVCDQGRCSPSEPTATVRAGNYPRAMPWDGRNWNGPSDTGNPEGASFPPGAYTLTADAKGTANGQPFEVRAQFCFLLVQGGGGPPADAANDAPADSSGSREAGASACAAAADCRAFSDYCGGCTCVALGAHDPDPTCDGGAVSCLLDPCAGHAAACGSMGRCVIQ